MGDKYSSSINKLMLNYQQEVKEVKQVEKKSEDENVIIMPGIALPKKFALDIIFFFTGNEIYTVLSLISNKWKRLIENSITPLAPNHQIAICSKSRFLEHKRTYTSRVL